MDPHEQRIVKFLSAPGTYPGRVTAVDRRETHVSHVFLAGDFAYKLKKPVKFPFLDASTLALRLKFCKLELSLNRRLAPAVYLDLVPVVETSSGLRLGASPDLSDTGPVRHHFRPPARAKVSGRVVEWLVRMRRLREDRMLDRQVATGRVTRGDMTGIARRLIPFFRSAARGPSVRRYGTPEAVERLVLGNLDECAPFIGHLLTEQERLRLKAAYRQYLTLHRPLLKRRLADSRIIDGHGDLRCENICIGPPVSIFDCVEFQPAFRCGDMANDFSFLLMDLEFRRRDDLAAALERAYHAGMRDRSVHPVLDFYKCHRTLVRGKVRGFGWLQHPRTPEGRRIRSLSRRHFQLAARYARRFAPPRLIAVGGVIGTGKSTLARGLAESLGASWLRTDEIRLREFPGRRVRRQGFAGGLYAPHVSDLVYQRLIRRAEALVRQGRSVVCDGTFSKAAGRDLLRVLARRHGASFHFFETTVPRAVALRRIARRAAAKSDISEARPEHYDRLRAGFEPVRGWPARDWTRLSDDRAPAATLGAAVESLRRAWGIPGD